MLFKKRGVKIKAMDVGSTILKENDELCTKLTRKKARNFLKLIDRSHVRRVTLFFLRTVETGVCTND